MHWSVGQRQEQRRRGRGAAGKTRARRIVDAYFSRDHFNDRETCCPLIGLPSEVSHGSDTVKAAYQDVLEKLLSLLEADLDGRDTRERALTLVTLCIGGLVASRNVDDPSLARQLREAAYRQARSVPEGRSCGVSMNSPPMLTLHTFEISSRPSHFQYTHTSPAT